MRRLGAAVLALLMALAGCRTLPPPPPAPLMQSAAEVISRLKDRQGELKSFQARGRLTLIAPGRSYSGTGRLTGAFPSTLRVGVLDFLGRSLLDFASDGRQVEVLFPREGKLYRGPATPGNLAAFIPPGLTLPQTLQLLTAKLPLSSGAPEEWRHEPGSGAYLLIWKQANGSLQERLWVAVEGLNPLKDEWYGADGNLTFTAEWSGAEGPGERPRKVTVRILNPATELRLAYQDFTPNPALSPADLTVPKPPGVAEVPLKP